MEEQENQESINKKQ